MSNPSYKCCLTKTFSVELDFREDSMGNPMLTLRGCLQPNPIYLSRPDVKDMISQLQSWIDTGDWIKPKKKYVCIHESKPTLFVEDSHGYINTLKDKYDQIYELTEENRVK